MVKNRSAGHYTDNYYQGVCCFAHTPPLLLTLRALSDLHVVHPMRPLHPMHQVHHHRTRPRRDRMERRGGRKSEASRT